jgi:hypothetical protein
MVPTDDEKVEEPFDLTLESLEPTVAPEEQLPDDVEPPALTAPALEKTPFAAPTELSLDTLAFPPRRANVSPQEFATEHAQVTAEAGRTYSGAAAQAREHSDRVFADTTDLYRSTVSQLRDSSRLVVPAQQTLNAAASDVAQRATRTLQTTATQADHTLEFGYGLALSQLRQTERRSRARVGRNAATSTKQVDAIITNLQSQYTRTLQGAIADTKSAADRACAKILEWESNPPVPPGPRSEHWSQEQEDVREEARRDAAPKMGKRERDGLRELEKKSQKNFQDANNSINESIKNGYRPPLDERAKKIRKEGQAAVTRAMKDAKHALREQTLDGRRAIAQTRQNAVAAVATQRRALASRIQGRTSQLLRALHAIASPLLNGLSVALRGVSPAFPRALDQLRMTLARASRLGLAAVRQVARSGGQQVEQATGQARVTQTQRMRASHTAARGDFTQRDTLGRREMGDELDRGSRQIGDSADTSAPLLVHAGDAYADAFEQGNKNVERVADSWAEPIAQTFAGMIKQAKKKLDEDHTKFLEGTADKPGFTRNTQELLNAFRQREEAATFFQEPLKQAAEPPVHKCETAVDGVAKAFRGGFLQTVDETGVTQALHALSPTMGRYVSYHYQWAYKRNLHDDLWIHLWDDPDDYNAAINYLAGNPVEGARYELAASRHWYNDEEDRITRTMTDLSPQQINELKASTDGRREIAATRDALGGVDLNVFDTLVNDANYARAEAYRLRDTVDEALRSGNVDAAQAAIVSYSAATDAGYGGEALSAAEHRRRVMRELGAIVRESGVGVTLDTAATRGRPLDELSPEEQDIARAAAYATRDVEAQVLRDRGPIRGMEVETITRHLDPTERARITALIWQGEESVEARRAGVGLELGRRGGPKLLNLDAALVDERFNPDVFNRLRPEEQDALRKERAEFLINLAKERSGGAPVPNVAAAQEVLRASFATAFHDDEMAARIATRLITDEYPSPDTAALAMEYATIHRRGTNTDLIDRMLGRMNREDIDRMRDRFHDHTGQYLDDVLGTFGHGGVFTELSGDDRLRVERKLLGVPRTDRERFELAWFEIEQQRKETGAAGAAMAAGDLADVGLTSARARLLAAAGGGEMVFREGRLRRGGNFTDNGTLKSGDPRELSLAVSMAHRTAENYAAYIDNLASSITTAIAVIGAIAATVLTFGAATPLAAALIAGAVTLGTGLVAMGAHRLISGGRYGWEEALLDLGTTAVQALTAGVGAGLGASLNAAKGAATVAQAGEQTAAKAAAGAATKGLARTVVNNVIVGTTTGVMGSVGHAALDPKTWEGGWEKSLETLFHACIRGALTGMATAAVSSVVEGIPAGRMNLGSGLQRVSLGDRMGNSSSMVFRGLTKAASSGAGGAVGRGVELTYDRATGRYRGDAGDILVGMGEAGAQSSIQAFGEGAGEARAHGARARRESLRARVEEKARPPATVEGTPRAARVPPIPEAGVHIAPPAADVVRPTVPAHEPGMSEPTAPVRRLAPEPPPPRTTVRAGAEPDVLAPPVVKVVEGEPPVVPVVHVAEPDVAATIRVPEAAPEPTVPARAAGAIELEGTKPAARPPGTFVEGTAAGVRDSTFHGRAVEAGAPEAAQTRTVKGAVRKVLASGAPEFTGARLPNPRDPTRIALHTHSGEEVMVRVRLSETPLPAGPDGMSPVARFSRDPHTGEYLIEVSAGAQARHVERAMAHELAEIRVGHGRANADDVLVPGRRMPAPELEGAAARLSPHDEGRLAELGVLARNLKTARTDDERGRLMADAEDLVAHLGLGESGKAADARRELAHQALAGRPDAQDLLMDAVLAHAPAKAAFAEIAAKRRAAAPSGLVEEETMKIPGRPEMARRPGDPRAGRSTVGETPADAARIAASLRAASREEAAQILRNAILYEGEHTALTQKTLEYLTPDQVDYIAEHGRLPDGLEYHHLMGLADYLEFAHRGDVGLLLPRDPHRAAHAYEPSRELEAATFVGPQEAPPFQIDPEATKGYRRKYADVAAGTRTTGDIDQDIQIEQRAEVAKMQREADRFERTVARLEETLAGLRARRAAASQLEGLEQRLGAARDRLDRLRANIEDTTAALEVTERLAAAAPVGGTAAGIRGTDFRGDVVPAGSLMATSLPTVDRAVGRVLGPGGVLEGVARLPDTDDARTIRVATRTGEEVTVRVAMSDSVLPTEADGLPPVARFDADPEHPDQYLIRVSPGAPRRHLERALAHELAEIRAQHGRSLVDDVLTPGGRPPTVQKGKTPSLSPHDEGRLAELAVIARQLAGTSDPGARIRLRDDAERLVTALGLVGPSAAAAARRAAARATVQSPDVATLLGDAVVNAERNPYLMRPSGDPRADLAALRATLDRVKGLDDPEQQRHWHEQLTRVAAQVLIDSRVVRPTRRGALVRPVELARLLGLDVTRPVTFAAGSSDPFEALLSRAMVEARRGIDGGTMMPSEARRPTPGFEAEFVDHSGKSVPASEAMRAEDALKPVGRHIERRIAVRKARIAQRAQLMEEHGNAATTRVRREEIEQEIETIDRKIREHSARLGEAAGREFARQTFGAAKPLDIGHSGAGVPDLLYELPDGRLILIECKGGTSPLGTRESADGRFLVQQGTVEYAQSLARTMENSPEPTIRALGERLRTALARNPPALDYYLVRQPFTPSGDLGPVESGRFDLTPNRPR